jgi:hypothetical protein
MRAHLKYIINNFCPDGQMTYDLFAVTSSYWSDPSMKARWGQLLISDVTLLSTVSLHVEHVTIGVRTHQLIDFQFDPGLFCFDIQRPNDMCTELKITDFPGCSRLKLTSN